MKIPTRGRGHHRACREGGCVGSRDRWNQNPHDREEGARASARARAREEESESGRAGERERVREREGEGTRGVRFLCVLWCRVVT